MAAQNGKDTVFTFKYATPGEVWAIGTALPAACALVVGLRFATRNLQKARIGLDDWLILGGLVRLRVVFVPSLSSDEFIPLDHLHWNRHMLHSW